MVCAGRARLLALGALVAPAPALLVVGHVKDLLAAHGADACERGRIRLAVKPRSSVFA